MSIHYDKDGNLCITAGAGFLKAWDKLMKAAWNALPQNSQQQTQTNMSNDTTDKQPFVISAEERKENIVRQIAEMSHWANKAWCHMNGDSSQPDWEGTPDWQRESAINGVKFHLDNPHAGPEDSHESWYREKLEAGWKYGPVKDPEKKEHPCMVAHKELDPTQQLKDNIYAGVVKGMLKFYLDRGDIKRPLTAGEDVMGIQFNPGGNPSVNRIKRTFADLHDLCLKEADAYHLVILNRPDNADGNALKRNQSGRMMAVALTNIEQAQMWAVKAVTR